MRFACLLLLCASIQGQTGSLNGHIYISGELGALDVPPVVADLTVFRGNEKLFVDDEQVTVKSDNQGLFHFEGLQPGTYNILVFSPGFATMNVRSVVVRAGQTTELPGIPIFLGLPCGGPRPAKLTPLEDSKRSVVSGVVETYQGDQYRSLKGVPASIRVGGREVSVTTEDDGSFRLEAPPGSYLFTASKYPAGRLLFLRGWKVEYNTNIVFRDRPAICE
jgi:hypothetical protein